MMIRNGGPYFRSSLARTVFARLQADQQLNNLDKSMWYTCQTELLSPVLLNTFLQCHLDNSTQVFLDNCHQKADWLFTQIFHSLAATFLGLFMTKTSINGWLTRGSMFVTSEKQFEALLGISESWKGDHLLDIGAGDGKVTEIMAKYFTQTSVTEASAVMRNILANKDYRVLEIYSWPQDTIKYDLISCLNVLDRCDRPQTLLKDMISKIKPETGRILLAIVIPFHPYVEFSPKHSTKPTEYFDIDGDTFEEQMNSLHKNVLDPLNLEIVRWSKLPYLCEGNLQRSFYWLIDAVLVLKLKSPENSVNAAQCVRENSGCENLNSCTLNIES